MKTTRKTYETTHTVRLSEESKKDAEVIKRAYGPKTLTQAIVTALRLTAQGVKN